MRDKLYLFGWQKRPLPTHLKSCYSLPGQSGQLQIRCYNFWPPTGRIADKKIMQTMALEKVKFKNRFAFFCGWLRTILWRCARAGAIHLTGSLTSVSSACDQWCDGAIFFICLCAGADGRYWTRPVKSGTTARQRFRSSTG